MARQENSSQGIQQDSVKDNALLLKGHACQASARLCLINSSTLRLQKGNQEAILHPHLSSEKDIFHSV
jgi:hypothetical protein